MGDNKKLSLTYRLLRRMGLNYSEEEYGQVTFWQVFKRVCKTYRDGFLLKYMMNTWLLGPMAPRKIRPWVLKKIGCHVGRDIFVGDNVRIDSGHSELIYIDDHAHITGGCRLLCHQRDLRHYRKGDDAAKLPYKLGEIHIGKGVMIGMESLIMPGVTIGDGAIVGAYSLVTKDIPAWTIATGRPAKVVKEIPERESENSLN
jgi:acetyltransferase-like isoleucine patch superfamily enzyme